MNFIKKTKNKNMENEYLNKKFYKNKTKNEEYSNEIKNDNLTNNSQMKNDAAFVINNLNLWYGDNQALFDINLYIKKNAITAIIGPSGCGKSTFLRCLNRLNDLIDTIKIEGDILLEGKQNINKSFDKNDESTLDVTELRTKVGMVFQKPNPFPMSIENNIVYGPKINGIKNNAVLIDIVEKTLKEAALWDEVKDKLKTDAISLSGGQQQRLCIARTIANQPDIILMDEPTSALDPIATKKIEDLLEILKKNYTIILVTHSMQQASRISDYTAFFYKGKLIEVDETRNIFTNPKKKKTEDYIRGKFG